jgi:hypothetical protein
VAEPAPAHPDAQPKLPRSRRYRRGAWLTLLVLLVVFGLLAIRAVQQVRATPDYWQDQRAFLEQTPAPQLQQMASDVEVRLPREWTRPIGRGSGRRQIRVQFDEINAWLAFRLSDYLDNQQIELPREIGQVILTQRDGELVAAFDYTSSQLGQRIASVFFSVENPPADAADLTVAVGISRAAAGQQKLPLRLLFDAVRDREGFDDPSIRAVLDELAAGRAVPLPPLPVDAYREAVVRGVTVEPLAVVLDVQVRATE